MNMNKLYAYKVTLTRLDNSQLQYDTIESTTDIPLNIETEYNKIITREDKRMKQHRINKYIVITERKYKRLDAKNVVSYYIHNEPFTLNNLPTVIDTINKIVTKDIKRLGWAYEDNQMDYYMKLSMNALIENYVKYKKPESMEITTLTIDDEDKEYVMSDEDECIILENKDTILSILSSNIRQYDKVMKLQPILYLTSERIKYITKYRENTKVFLNYLKKYLNL